MRPAKITIAGRYWDSQLYSGSLFLFTEEGSMKVIDWKRLVSELDLSHDLSLAKEWAFLDGSRPYKYAKNHELWGDMEIKEAVRDKFLRLAKNDIEISDKLIARYCFREQDAPFSFPHSDCEIYFDRIYSAGKCGLYSCPLGIWLVGSGSKTEKHWDCPVLSVAARHSTLALAAGTEGLYQLDIWGYSSSETGHSQPERLDGKHTSTVSWAYHCIYASSTSGGGCLAEFTKESIDPRENEGRQYQRIPYGTYDTRDLLGKDGYSWCCDNRVCIATNRSNVFTYNYQTPRKNRHDLCNEIGQLRFGRPKYGEFVSGATTVFGTVLEFDEGLCVVHTEESEKTSIAEEPVNWRVFPRSKFYQNQLHVVFDDRLEILSFNHDCFIKQSGKLAGSLPMREMDKSEYKHNRPNHRVH